MIIDLSDPDDAEWIRREKRTQHRGCRSKSIGMDRSRIVKYRSKRTVVTTERDAETAGEGEPDIIRQLDFDALQQEGDTEGSMEDSITDGMEERVSSSAAVTSETQTVDLTDDTSAEQIDNSVSDADLHRHLFGDDSDGVEDEQSDSDCEPDSHSVVAEATELHPVEDSHERASLSSLGNPFARVSFLEMRRSYNARVRRRWQQARYVFHS